MRWLAILCVLGYRALLRRLHRRICLYDESCSAFAIRVLRRHGLQHGTPLILDRLRSCRMPISACFVLDEHGHAVVLSASTFDGGPVAQNALAMIAAEAVASGPHGDSYEFPDG